nr:hypothetical protein GCM10020185_47330 [Pseudomonas brassicacearum subsp. brassicacearum]
MSNKFHLSDPLNVEGWEIVETLERFTLYDEFAHRIQDALELIREGQEHWMNHQKKMGSGPLTPFVYLAM